MVLMSDSSVSVNNPEEVIKAEETIQHLGL